MKSPPLGERRASDYRQDFPRPAIVGKLELSCRVRPEHPRRRIHPESKVASAECHADKRDRSALGSRQEEVCYGERRRQ